MSIKSLLVLSIFSLTSTSYAGTIASFNETNAAVNMEKVARVMSSKKDTTSRSIDADMMKKFKISKSDSKSEIATNNYGTEF